MAFLRLLSNKTVMCGSALTLREAWNKSKEFLTLPEVSFANEPSSLDEHWSTLINPESSSPNVWTDSYLAAFARAAGMRFVTLDRGFLRFRLPELLLLRLPELP